MCAGVFDAMSCGYVVKASERRCVKDASGCQRGKSAFSVCTVCCGGVVKCSVGTVCCGCVVMRSSVWVLYLMGALSVSVRVLSAWMRSVLGVRLAVCNWVQCVVHVLSVRVRCVAGTVVNVDAASPFHSFIASRLNDLFAFPFFPFLFFPFFFFQSSNIHQGGPENKRNRR